MKKKEYIQPAMKLIQLDGTDIICSSTGANAGRFRFYNEEVDNSGSGDYWGSQW